MQVKRVIWGVAVLVFLLLGCDTPASEESAIARLDISDDSCAGLQDPILLAHVFGFGNGNWIVAQPADLVAAEIARESDPQDRVIVNLPAVDSEAISVRPTDQDVIYGNSTTIREDKFEGLEIVSPLGGSVYLQVFKQGRNRPSSTSMLAWIDSVGDVHFLGQCGWYLWTEPLARFAEELGWEGTQEELLVALINRGPEFDALKQWTFAPSET